MSDRFEEDKEVEEMLGKVFGDLYTSGIIMPDITVTELAVVEDAIVKLMDKRFKEVLNIARNVAGSEFGHPGEPSSLTRKELNGAWEQARKK